VQGNEAIKNATSILDYIFRELAVSYLAVTTSRTSIRRKSSVPRRWARRTSSWSSMANQL